MPANPITRTNHCLTNKSRDCLLHVNVQSVPSLQKLLTEIFERYAEFTNVEQIRSINNQLACAQITVNKYEGLNAFTIMQVLTEAGIRVVNITHKSDPMSVNTSILFILKCFIIHKLYFDIILFSLYTLWIFIVQLWFITELFQIQQKIRRENSNRSENRGEYSLFQNYKLQLRGHTTSINFPFWEKYLASTRIFLTLLESSPC